MMAMSARRTTVMSISERVLDGSRGKTMAILREHLKGRLVSTFTSNDGGYRSCGGGCICSDLVGER